MDPLSDMARAVRKFDAETSQEIIAIAKTEEDTIKRMNQEQMYAGINAEGARIRPPYRPFTKRIKRSLGQPVDRVTLKDTGDFYESIQVRYGRSAFVLTATDPKVGKIIRKYGKDVFGLTEQNIDRLSRRILGKLQQALQKRILR